MNQTTNPQPNLSADAFNFYFFTKQLYPRNKIWATQNKELMMIIITHECRTTLKIMPIKKSSLVR